jgi:broad specificity phosphatase PhoE
MGALQGMDKDNAAPFLTFFEKHPDVRVPEGEKFRTFYNRFKNVFDHLIGHIRKFPAASPLVVTHSQDLDIIQWFLKGIEPGRTLEFGNGLQPGGILEVRLQNGELVMRKPRV